MRTTTNWVTIGSFEFNSEHILGKGATGQVYKGRTFNDLGFRSKDGKSIAVKAI